MRPGPCSELIVKIDLLPTLLDLCGVSIPVNVEGRSFAPAVTGAGSYTPAVAVYAENIIPEVITGGERDYYFVPRRGD